MRDLNVVERYRASKSIGWTNSFVLGLVAMAATVIGFTALSARGDQHVESKSAAPAKPKLGRLINDMRACRGYTLLAPSFSTVTYLIDMDGRIRP